MSNVRAVCYDFACLRTIGYAMLNEGSGEGNIPMRHHPRVPADAAELGPKVTALGRLSYPALVLEYVDAARKMVELDVGNRHAEGLYRREFVLAMRWTTIVALVLGDTDPNQKGPQDA